MRDLIEQRRLHQQQMKKEFLELEAEKRLRARMCLEGVIEQERLMPGSQDLRSALRTVRMFRRRGFI